MQECNQVGSSELIWRFMKLLRELNSIWSLLRGSWLKVGELIDRDPVQASEKLYKAAEEAVKAIAIALNLPEAIKALERVAGRYLY
jgi:hypothetical protein